MFRRLLITLLLGALCGFSAPPDTGTLPLPQGLGLAAHYPGDRSIEKDPAVLFHEDFERGDIRQWEDPKGPVTVTPDAPHGGMKCVAMPMHRGRDTGAHLLKWFLPGADRVYARFYVKFSANYQYNHHFV